LPQPESCGINDARKSQAKESKPIEQAKSPKLNTPDRAKQNLRHRQSGVTNPIAEKNFIANKRRRKTWFDVDAGTEGTGAQART